MIKYPSVLRYGKRETIDAVKGDIVIMEKIDGANASVRLTDKEITCYSRNKQLDESDTLRGFYGFVQDHFKTNKADAVGEFDFIFYGEWNVPHTIKYPEETQRKFYLFDIYDVEEGLFIPIEDVIKIAEHFKLEVAPIFYKGEFQSIEHIQSFVGESKLGEFGEGVVVKNVNHFDKHGNQVWVKFISEKFSESHKSKVHKVKENTTDPLTQFVNNNLTEARVEKMLHKLVDEGTLSEDYSITDMGLILKSLGSRLFDDIIQEELDQLLKLIKGKVGRNTPNVVKEVLSKQGRG